MAGGEVARGFEVPIAASLFLSDAFVTEPPSSVVTYRRYGLLPRGNSEMTVNWWWWPAVLTTSSDGHRVEAMIVEPSGGGGTREATEDDDGSPRASDWGRCGLSSTVADASPLQLLNRSGSNLAETAAKRQLWGLADARREHPWPVERRCWQKRMCLGGGFGAAAVDIDDLCMLRLI
ncbi:hypothetical protein AAHA92_28941 [Salvia divinorum]|uniref:Uncharacterized protein n=1 Tax=Salvia divinorum TaxID=28513 RepID=A0ABD1FWP1_SALDI